MKIIKLLSFLLFAGIILSCSKDEESIRLSKDTMYISNSGGSDTIKVLNYKNVRLTGEAEVHMNDSIYWVSSYQSGLYQDMFSVDGDWFKITVPDKAPNMIVATVDGSKLNPNDKWSISMGIANADVYSRIEIKTKN